MLYLLTRAQSTYSCCRILKELYVFRSFESSYKSQKHNQTYVRLEDGQGGIFLS